MTRIASLRRNIVKGALAAMLMSAGCGAARAETITVTHWGSAFKYCAHLNGLPVGDYPHSRPPQLKLTDDQKAQIKAAYVNAGLIDG